MEQQNVPMKVSVYTITYNQCEIVKKTIAGLFEQDYPQTHYEIIVLDDGSNDDTLTILSDLSKQSPVPMRVLSCVHEADYMSAKRWNQCIAACSPQTEVFIQIDDVRLRPDFISQHIKWHIRGNRFLVTGAKFEGLTETWDLSTCQRSHLAEPDGKARQTNFFTAVWGASLSFSRALMKKIYQPPYELPFDERMTGWGFQEVEFAYRLQKAGAKIIYDPAAGVFHQDHIEDFEMIRGLKRTKLVSQGVENNKAYLLGKHTLSELPRW